MSNLRSFTLIFLAFFSHVVINWTVVYMFVAPSTIANLCQSLSSCKPKNIILFIVGHTQPLVHRPQIPRRGWQVCEVSSKRSFRIVRLKRLERPRLLRTNSLPRALVSVMKRVHVFSVIISF